MGCRQSIDAERPPASPPISQPILIDVSNRSLSRIADHLEELEDESIPDHVRSKWEHFATRLEEKAIHVEQANEEVIVAANDLPREPATDSTQSTLVNSAVGVLDPSDVPVLLIPKSKAKEMANETCSISDGNNKESTELSTEPGNAADDVVDEIIRDLIQQALHPPAEPSTDLNVEIDFDGEVDIDADQEKEILEDMLDDIENKLRDDPTNETLFNLKEEILEEIEDIVLGNHYNDEIQSFEETIQTRAEEGVLYDMLDKINDELEVNPSDSELTDMKEIIQDELHDLALGKDSDLSNEVEPVPRTTDGSETATVEEVQPEDEPLPVVNSRMESVPMEGSKPFVIRGTSVDGGVVLYRIQTSGGKIVLKRYNDFKLLYATMAHAMTRDGKCNLTPMPRAGMLSRFYRQNQALLDERARAFEAMLNSIAHHSLASSSMEFQQFFN